MLLLDEPTTYLDPSHQVDVLDLIRRLHDDSGRTAVMVLHDLNLAARYADRLVAMKAAAIAAEGPPGEVLTEKLLSDVFELNSRVISDPVMGTQVVVPVGGRRVSGNMLTAAQAAAEQHRPVRAQCGRTRRPARPH